MQKVILWEDIPGYTEFVKTLNIFYENSTKIFSKHTKNGYPVNDTEIRNSLNNLQALIDNGKMDLLVEWLNFYEKLLDIQANPPTNELKSVQTPIYNNTYSILNFVPQNHKPDDAIKPKLQEENNFTEKNKQIIITGTHNIVISPEFNVNLPKFSNLMDWLKTILGYFIK